MKRKARFFSLLLAAALILALPASAAVSAAERPPVFTVVAPFAPKDTKATIRLVKKGETVPVLLEAKRRGWETQFRLYREAVYSINEWYGNAYDLKDAVLVLEGGGETKTVPIPEALLTERGGEDYAALNWRAGRLGPVPAWRAPLLLLVWIGIALAIEGAIFFCYGYRYKRSWLVFLLVNIVTQGAHHLLVSGINVDTNRVKIYIFCMPIVFLAELAAFPLLVDERGRDRAIGYAAAANLASQAALGLLLTVLPT